jgi:hypothetical protein
MVALFLSPPCLGWQPGFQSGAAGAPFPHLRRQKQDPSRGSVGWGLSEMLPSPAGYRDERDVIVQIYGALRMPTNLSFSHLKSFIQCIV